MIIRVAKVIRLAPPTFVARMSVIPHAYDHMVETHSVNGSWIDEKNHSVTVGTLEINKNQEAGRRGPEPVTSFLILH